MSHVRIIWCVLTPKWDFGRLSTSQHVHCYNSAFDSVVTKVGRLHPGFWILSLWILLRWCGSVHCAGKWTNGTMSKQQQVDLASLWSLAASQYLSVSKQAIKFLLPFTTTYLCDSGFSIVAVTKSKARNKLKAILNATLHVSLSPIPPRLDLIISQKQAQVFHWG